MKINSKDFILWVATWLIIIFLFMFFWGNTTLVEESVVLENRKTVLEILLNNSQNFLLYIIFFPLSIVMTFWEFLLITLNICVSIQNIGFKETILLLLPHTLLEFPNILFYSYLSFHLLKVTLKDFKFTTVLKTISINRNYYILSYIILVIAAIIEGELG